MSKKTLLWVVGIIVVLTTFVGLDNILAWGIVFRNTLTVQIDKALGENDVRAERSRRMIADLENTLEEMHAGEITARYQADRLASRRGEIEPLVAAAQEVFAQVEVAHASGVSFVRGDKTFATRSEQENLMRRLQEYIQSREDRLDGLRVPHDAYTRSAELLLTARTTGYRELAVEKGRLDEFVAKKGALEALQGAIALAGESKSFADQFSALQNEIDSMLGGVEAGLARAERDLDVPLGGDADIEQLLAAGGSADSLASILGGN